MSEWTEKLDLERAKEQAEVARSNAEFAREKAENAKRHAMAGEATMCKAKEKLVLSKFWWHFLYLSFIFMFIVAWGFISYHNYRNMGLKMKKLEKTFEFQIRTLECSSVCVGRKDYETK